ncbi:MAG: AAA family ATPase [Pseudomonadota bacterium]|nr:AAA family ATPase [Pseudomonadota bacterium]
MKYHALARSHLQIFEGGFPVAVKRYGETPSTDLMIVECDFAPDALIDRLEDLAEVCTPDTKVILVGAHDSIQLYRELGARGIGEYLVSPPSAREVLDSIFRLFDVGTLKRRSRTTAIMGVKGGTGASTIAHNLAWSMGDLFDQDVCLVDMDIRFGTATIDFNHETRQGLREAAFQADRLDEAFLETYIAEHDSRVRLLASPPNLSDAKGLDVQGLDKVIDLLRGVMPNIVLDIPHLWQDWVVELMGVADSAVIVAEPDLPSLRNAQLIMDQIGQRRPLESPLRYVLNNCGLDKRSGLSAHDFNEALGSYPLVEFAFDPATYRAASSGGQMLGQMNNKLRAVQTFKELAEKIGGRKTAQSKRKNCRSRARFKR